MKHLNFYTFAYLVFFILSAGSTHCKTGNESGKIWVGTWSTAPQLVEPGNMPPLPGLTNNTLRQIVRVSIGGDTMRLRFCNIFSREPVVMKSVQIAVSAGGSAIYEPTNKKLTFNGKYDVTMDSGASIVSDPVAFNLQPRMNLCITIYFGNTSATVTGHPGSRTTSYILAGNDTSVRNFTGAVTTDHWYVINGIDVLKPRNFYCLAILGNSITDGRGSTTNLQNRWTDILSERLLANQGTERTGVLNLGIGGNCVLRNCLGPAAVDRYKRDILNQCGLRAIVIFEGINDIGAVRTLADANSVSENLEMAYTKMIDSAHAKNIFVYGATIMPVKGNGYFNEFSEMCRNKVNSWIRYNGSFDAVIDFDKITRNVQDTASLGITTNQNDCLHPSAEGHKKMADSINLNLFKNLDKVILKKYPH
jgi:lysophospholipase L1-like esterase